MSLLIGMMSNMKNYPHHTMLPVHLQNMLKAAASSGRIETIDRAVKDIQRAAPNKFHDEKTVSDRRFLNEPRQNVPNAGFEIPYPEGRTRS